MNLATSPSFRGSLASPTTPTSGSLRSSKPNWHKPAPKAGAAVEIRQRVLVFVAGGMTYSEMREAYLLSKSLNKDIIIGELLWWRGSVTLMLNRSLEVPPTPSPPRAS